ncbi:hypothetical protein OSB04_007862 [Centaurea solstitialis]|uniref:GPI-anchored protein LLG1-like domain-containing protein n=1 Tax=Centaurea solstitialis TaxID=347529 RepID=A0AA38WIW6_9ASTR|nr:hypothetical protein OSB04_007862 [Centaurea solstitialis]
MNTSISIFLLLCCCISTCFSSPVSISDGVFSSEASIGRNLLQAKKPCPVNFRFMNYTIITSRCNGPQYPPNLCCQAFKDFACPYAEDLNDLSNNSATADANCRVPNLLVPVVLMAQARCFLYMPAVVLFSLEPNPSCMTSTSVPVPVTLLQMCSNSKEIKQLHAQLVVWGLIRRRINASRLIASYVTFGQNLEALSVFHTISSPDVYAYNTIIRGLILAKCPHDSLLLYNKLLEKSLTPDNYTYTYVLKACSHLKALSEGEQLHAQIIKAGTKPDTFVHSSMINMYASSGELVSAKRVVGEFSEENVVVKNSMISGYMNQGQVELAHQVFDKMSKRDSASWSAMISGYTRNGMYTEALVAFREMIGSKTQVNESTLVSVLSACGHLGALDQGRWIHVYINRTWDETVSVNLGTSIVDMYARCGCLEFGYEFFKNMPEKDVVTWGVIISGFAAHGRAKKCFQLLDEMAAYGTQPNEVVFVAVLSACSHAGLVDLGRFYFNQMTTVYGIRPSIHHYGCMVDLLSRAGRLVEAEELVSTMVEEPNTVIWGALLAGCRIHGDLRRGEYAFKKLVRLEPLSVERFKLASHLFVDTREHECVCKLRKDISDENLETTRGSSLIEVDGEVHEFVASDIDHRRYREIYSVF